MKIDWDSSANHLLLNPRLPEADVQRLRMAMSAADGLTSHFFIATSGSTAADASEMKLVAVSKAAVLASAAAVNAHLQAQAGDVWLHALPDFHVGGLGIRARSYLSGARVVQAFEDARWDAARFFHCACACEATLSALVPTQLHDLVRGGYQAPASLRAIVIGGDRLNEDLYIAARSLGWNVLPSYGMTEACSQIATAALASLRTRTLPHLQLLAGVEADVDEDTGLLKIRSPSLLSGYCISSGLHARFVDPRKDGWFVTSDYGQVEGATLLIDGRQQDLVKVGAENVNLARLDRILEQLKSKLQLQTDVALAAIPDERLGARIELVSAAAAEHEITALVNAFNNSVQPFERIRQCHLAVDIPRTALGKLSRAALVKALVSRRT